MGARTTVDGIMLVGQALLEARELFNGNKQAFGKRREERLPWMDRLQATRFMQVSESYGGKAMQRNVASELSVTVLYAYDLGKCSALAGRM